MKPSSAIRSAIAPAFIRVIESYRSKEIRLFDDQFTYGILPPPWRGLVNLMRVPGLGTAALAIREHQFPGVMGNLICRTRFIDEVLCAALRQGQQQVVILGSGFDSRASRIPGIDRTHVFEVDHPDTQALKKARLVKKLKALPPHVTFVPIDFDRQKLEDVMLAKGFQPGLKTFFIWEGVTQYITAEAVDAIFRYVSQAAAAGSEIVFTYIHRGIIDGSARSKLDQKLVSLTQRYGMPWIFGFDPDKLAACLASHGLELVEDVGAADYQTRYLDPGGRQMNVYKGERVAVARLPFGGAPSTA